MPKMGVISHYEIEKSGKPYHVVAAQNIYRKKPNKPIMPSLTQKNSPNKRRHTVDIKDVELKKFLNSGTWF